MAALLDDGTATDLDAAMTKLYLSDCFVRCSLDAVQVHGGAGYMTEIGLERDVRDALGSQFYSGTSDMQRNVIARHLGL
jgi:alkylation response protein AidB-like acyl-CoA dehydrogenase